MSWIIPCIAGVLSGMLGSMGLGGGGVLIIYLTLFAGLEQQLAQGINLIFFIPMAILSIIIYFKKKLISWSIAWPMAILGVIGSFIGTYIAGFMNNNILGKIFGVLLFIMGLIQLFGKYNQDNA